MNTEIFPEACYQGALYITSFPIFDIDPFKPTHIFFQTTASERAAAKRHHVQTDDTRAKRRKCVDLRPFQEPLNEEEEKMLEYLESTDMEYIFGKNMDDAAKTATEASAIVDIEANETDVVETAIEEANETDVVETAIEEANEIEATDTAEAIDQELLIGDFASLYPTTTTCQFLIDQQEIVHNQQEIIHENQKQLADQHNQLKQLVDQLQQHQQQQQLNTNQVVILPDVQFESLFADMDSFLTNDKTFEVSSSFDTIKPKPITCTPKRCDKNLKTKLYTIVEINDYATWTNFYSTTPDKKFINCGEKNKKIDKFLYQMFFNPSCIYDKVKRYNPDYGTYVEETTILEWHEFGKSLNILQPQILAFLWAIDQNKNFWNWRNVIVALSTSHFFSKNKK